MTKTRMVLLSCCLPLLGAQTLRVERATATPGKDVAVTLVFDAGPGGAAGRVVAGLQWEIAFPAKAQGLETPVMAAGADAESAGKSLSCSGHWKKAVTTYAYTCILAGGKGAMASGRVATLTMKVRPDAKPGEHAVTLDQVKGVAADGVAVPVKASSGTLTIARP
jgi:hypothetical protein